MQEAVREAQTAGADGEIPIGAVVVCAGRIIAKGHNMTELLHDPTAHAEMIALTAATESLGGKYLDKCTLYVTVEPCPMCAAALCWSQLGRLVYGAPDPKRGFSLYSLRTFLKPCANRWINHIFLYLCRIELGYGVMAALKFLALAVQVRILISQQKREFSMLSFFVGVCFCL